MPIPFFASPPNRHHLLGVCVFQAPTAELGSLIVGASYSRKYPLADHGAFELAGELGVWDVLGVFQDLIDPRQRATKVAAQIPQHLH